MCRCLRIYNLKNRTKMWHYVQTLTPSVWVRPPEPVRAAIRPSHCGCADDADRQRAADRPVRCCYCRYSQQHRHRRQQFEVRHLTDRFARCCRHRCCQLRRLPPLPLPERRCDCAATPNRWNGRVPRGTCRATCRVSRRAMCTNATNGRDANGCVAVAADGRAGDGPWAGCRCRWG